MDSINRLLYDKSEGRGSNVKNTTGDGLYSLLAIILNCLGCALSYSATFSLYCDKTYIQTYFVLNILF